MSEGLILLYLLWRKRDESMSTLIGRIQELRKAKGIKSIRELERKSGIKEGSIRDWDRLSPRGEYLSKVADVLDTSVDQLLDRIDTSQQINLDLYPNAKAIALAAIEVNVDEETAKVVINVMKTLMETKSDEI